MNFSIILPAFNEAENLSPLLGGLKSELDRINIQYEIVVVDNGSTDNTQEVLQSLKKEIPELKTVKVWSNIGFGNGILRGLSVAQGEILGFMDADGQFKAKDLADIYLKLKEDKLDLCRGIRVKRHDGWKRKLASKGFHLIFKVIFGASFNDINGKPKVFRRELYEAVNPTSKDWFIDAEIMLKAQKRKYKIGEVALTALARKKGKSKVRFGTIFEFLKNLIHYRFFSKI